MAASGALGRQWQPPASIRTPEYPTTGRAGQKRTDPARAAERMTKTGRWDAQLEATRKGLHPSKN